MKRRILLVDDEIAVLLTMKAVLEISGFDVETAASAREGKLRLRSHEYDMVITDMRMENDEAGHEVIQTARTASYHPAVALLTAFPVDEADWQDLGADQLLLKPMHTRVLLDQIDQLFATREQRLASLNTSVNTRLTAPAKKAAKKKAKPAKKAVVKKSVAKKKASGLETKATAKIVAAKNKIPVIKKQSAVAKKTAKAAKKIAKPLKTL